MKLTLIADEDNARAREAAARLTAHYAFVPEDAADIGVVVGGDGFMLHTLHRMLRTNLSFPVYGLNLGTVGFLMNQWPPDGLLERIETAEIACLSPLSLTAHGADSRVVQLKAINEVSLFRASAQTAAIRIVVDDETHIERLMGDGLLVATAAGSTAYNRSAGGPILPLGAALLALTPLAPFRPRGWRGALLPNGSRVTLHVLEHEKRPVHAAADSQQIDCVQQVIVETSQEGQLRMLFDAGHSLERRILREQFPS